MLMARDNSSQMRRRAANPLSPPRAEPTFVGTSTSTALQSPSIYSPPIVSIRTMLSPDEGSLSDDSTVVVPYEAQGEGIRLVKPPSADSLAGEFEDLEIRSPLTPASEQMSDVERHTIERNLSVASADRAYVGRSISYHRPAPGSEAPFELHVPPAPSIGPMTFVPSSLPRDELQVRMEVDEGVDLGQVVMSRTHSTGSSAGTGSTGSATIRPILVRAPSAESGRTVRKQMSMSALTVFSLSRKGSNGTDFTEFTASSGRKSVRFADEKTPRISPDLRHTSKFPARWVGGLKNYGSDCDGEWEEWQDERGVGGGRLWTKHKQLLLASIASAFAVSLTTLILSLLTYFRLTPHTYPLLVTDPYIILLTFLASVLMLVSTLIGLTGALLNSRQLLAVYSISMWPCLWLVLVVAYTSFKKQDLSLDLKLNEAWSRSWTQAQRLVLQDSLHCCGYYSPLHEATLSNSCYPRTSLPGCKPRLLRFERQFLTHVYTAAFALAALHMVNLAVALVCSNHVNRTFGKGLMPRAYRLNALDIQQNAIKLARANSAPRPRHLRRPSSLSSLSTANSWSMQKLPVEGGLCGLGMAVGEEAEQRRTGDRPPEGLKLFGL